MRVLYNGVVPAVERAVNRLIEITGGDEAELVVESADFDSDSALADMRRAMALGL